MSSKIELQNLSVDSELYLSGDWYFTKNSEKQIGRFGWNLGAGEVDYTEEDKCINGFYDPISENYDEILGLLQDYITSNIEWYTCVKHNGEVLE